MKGERIMQNEWIVISEYCDKCHIEPTFIDMLCESGLIDVEQEGGERYLPFSELPDVERYSRMYYDLSINMEGIEPSTICWQGWKRCSGRYTRCAAG